MLVRYTRQLATAALIVAAGLGMGACSAHPGAAVSTNNGDYSIAEINEAVAQFDAVTAGQSAVGEQQVRASLVNGPQLAAVGASVGVAVTMRRSDATIAQTAQKAGGQSPKLGRAAREAVRSMLLGQKLSAFANANPAAVSTMNEVFAQARATSDARINPAFHSAVTGWRSGSCDASVRRRRLRWPAGSHGCADGRYRPLMSV